MSYTTGSPMAWCSRQRLRPNYIGSCNNGFALPMVIMTTALLMVLAVGFMTVASRERQGTSDEINLTKALYLADAGVELTLQYLAESSFVWSDFVTNLGQGQSVKVSRAVGEIGDGSNEVWHFNSEGTIEDEEGKVLARRSLQATVKRAFLPGQFTEGVDPGNSLLLGGNEDPQEAIFYHRGDLTLFGQGEFRGRFILAVDGKITVEGCLQPGEAEDSLTIISSRQVELAGGCTLWAVIFTPTCLLGNHSSLFGRTICGTVIKQPGSVQVSDSSTYSFEEQSINFVQGIAPYRPMLVRWRELYPVF
ncbi:hypothetical protein [Desulforamulus aquiferis]|uniref:Type 4 fimbrial biogenesis protein PilX N-terminal domain-containing protein n=1 Tax=Desulforamulus aquiferis TaxID=1397668 RepID=A0AAW7ZGS4_9FIRM|nr:hypothetical protein [Desulforamulus aquiferis]MDO7788660.1 hypothetical protein [Desulforamulus aquiferis]